MVASLGARNLLIFPCNGNGVEAMDCLAATDRVLGFVDDSRERQGTTAFGVPVLDRSALAVHAHASVLAVPGSPASFRSRRGAIEGLGVEADRFVTVVHPTAAVSPRATLGRNVLLMAGVVIVGNAVIEDHVCILPNTVIHHDTVVGTWSLIGSAVVVAGAVVVEENCYVGSGTNVMQGVRLGAKCLVGLGSNVIRDVLPGAVVGGNPARRLS